MTRARVRVALAIVLGAALAASFFAAGLTAGLMLPRPSARPAPAAAPATPGTDTQVLFAPFWQAWEIAQREFVDQPLDETRLMQGAIRGMLQALGDPHSSYMDPDEYMQANMPMAGAYEGIGAWVDTEAERLTIIAPMPGSPAENAGLRPGDEVIAVDGDDVTGLDPNLVVRRILGPAGSSLSLTVVREGEPEPLTFELERARIVVPSIESEWLEGDIGYVRLYNFGSQTPADLRAALRELMARQPRGLILDLRGNGGGLLTSAVRVASEFIADGVVLIERYGDGREEVFRAERGGLATGVPLVVLIDRGSASASEIVAGAIQDYGRGLLVGETSFGKGSVQNWVPLADNGGAVRITVARWLTPEGRRIDEVGLIPDVEVPFTEADVEAERDPQLERALALLLEGAVPATAGAGGLQ